MGAPFVSRWELSSLRVNHGSFVEAAQVKPLAGQPQGDWWVERPVPGLRPEHLARLRRRWYLASKLTSPAWPALVDAGEDNGEPWAVVESPGRRVEGGFPFADPSAALRAVRGLALAVAEAEALLAAHHTSPHVSLRPPVLARDERGALRLNLAALDTEPDEGFPASPLTWMWTPEALHRQPETARSNVFALGWLLALALTGRWPWGKVPEGESETKAKELLLAALATGKPTPLQLPEALKPVEAILRRALQPLPGQRFGTAQAFAEALAPLAPAVSLKRTLVLLDPVKLAPPPFDPRFEALSPELEAKLQTRLDEGATWLELADTLEGLGSSRGLLIRAQHAAEHAPPGKPHPKPPPALLPSCAGEALGLQWKWGYVRVLAATPEGAGGASGAAHETALQSLLSHPSLRFLQELRLEGSLSHAKPWLEVLQKGAVPPGLRRVHVEALTAKDPASVDLAFRYPRWTWTWGHGEKPGFFQKLFGKR